jgi:hypothetical protein
MSTISKHRRKRKNTLSFKLWINGHLFCISVNMPFTPLDIQQEEKLNRTHVCILLKIC